MLIEENKTNVRRLFEAASTGKMEVLDKLIIPDLIIHDDDPLPFGRGRESVKKLITGFRTAFPDATFTVEQIFAEQDRVVSHVTVRGTHIGRWLGVDQTGKEIKWTASCAIRFANGKIAELWVIQDELGMMQQLGMVSMIRG
jgi:predicted ester cyclase